MNILSEKSAKATYSPPAIERTALDNEISLALMSNPPAGPDENYSIEAPGFFNNDPYKGNMA